MNRRQFLKAAMAGAAAVASSAVFAPLALAQKFFREPPWRRKRPYWGYAIDATKCIGCARCVDACKTENHVPREPFFFRTWVERYVTRSSGETEVDSPNGGLDGYPPVRDPAGVLKSYFVPKICNQCENSPCVQVCPVGASYKTEDGVVMVDTKYCIGCRYCVQACPYGSRFFNPILKVAEKCTLCYHRIHKGLRPACVENCPTGTRIFGDLGDPASPVSRFLDHERVMVLKPEMGTQPKVAYKGLDKEVR